MGGRLEVRGLSRRYGSGRGIGSVDLDVASGELFALTGPSGSGKSTLLRLIAGLERPDSGSIAIDGTDVTSRSPHERDLGMTFDDGALYEHLAVGRNVEAALDRKRLRGAAAREKALDALRMVGAEQLVERRPHTLSAGERRRVALARAIVGRPALLLLDEPLTHLDRAARLDLREDLLAAQRATGATTLLVTHDHDDAIALADRIAFLSNGLLRQVGTAAELLARPMHVEVAIGFGPSPMNLVSADSGHIGFRPESATIETTTADGLWTLAGSISSVHVGGATVRVADGQRVRVPILNCVVSLGQSVRVAVAPRHLTHFGADGRRLD